MLLCPNAHLDRKIVLISFIFLIHKSSIFCACIELKIKGDLCSILQWSVFCQDNNLILLFCYTFYCIEFKELYIIQESNVLFFPFTCFLLLIVPLTPPTHTVWVEFHFMYTYVILCICVNSRQHRWEKRCDVCLFETGWICLINLLNLLLHPFFFLQIVYLWSFLWMKKSIVHMNHIFLVCSSAVGHLSWFYNFIVNRGAININV